MKKLLWALMGLMVIPVVLADIYMPFIMRVWGAGIYLIIPTIFIEALVAFIILKKLGYWKSVLIFLVANIASAIVGFALLFIPALSVENLVLIIPFYVLTAIIEMPVIWLFIKKMKKPWEKSLIVSFAVNAVSYLILFVVVVLLFQ